MINIKGTKIFASVLAITSILTLGSFKANAEWKEDSIGWKYNVSDNFVTGWQNIDEEWYHFDNNGYMDSDKYVGDFYLGSNGAMIGGTGVEDPFANVDSIKNSMPITIPDNWSAFNDKIYIMNNTTPVMYDKKETCGKTEINIISEIRSSFKNKSDFKGKVKKFNGNFAYCYEYSEINGDKILKVNTIFIFKNNMLHAFTMVSESENYYNDKTELENVLKSSLNI